MGTASGRPHVLIKVETHNHPTAIAPYPRSFYWSRGGDPRRGGRPALVAGRRRACAPFSPRICALPGFAQPWEKERAAFPDRLATPLAIMTEGPIGGAGLWQ